METLKKVKNLWENYQERNSEESLEREELKKSLEGYEKDLTVIMKAGFHEQFPGDRAFNMASLIQNLHMQKKLTQATRGLKMATWILVSATIVLAWATILDSPNSSYIFKTIQNIVEIIVLLLIIVVVITLIWKIFKFIYQKIKSIKK